MITQEGKISTKPRRGWQGILNIFRKLFGRPIAVKTEISFQFNPPIVLKPKQSLGIEINEKLSNKANAGDRQ